MLFLNVNLNLVKSEAKFFCKKENIISFSNFGASISGGWKFLLKSKIFGVINSGLLRMISSEIPLMSFLSFNHQILSENSFANRQSWEENRISFFSFFAKLRIKERIINLFSSSRCVVGSSKIMKGEF